MGLGRTRLSIRSDSAFHLGKWPKTRIFRNFELRRIRKAFCPASPKIILGLGLGLTCRFQPPAFTHWCFSAPKTAGDRAPEPQRGAGGGGRRLCGGGPSAGVAGSPLGRPAAAGRAAAAPASGGGAPEGGHIFRRNLTKVRPDPPTPSSDGPLVGPDRWGRPGRAFSTFGGRCRETEKGSFKWKGF